MDPKLVLEAADAGLAIARYLWHKAHGDDTKPDAAAIKAAAAEAAIAASAELERHAIEAGISAASVALTKATSDLLYELARVETDPSPDIPNILTGAQIEQMPAGWVPPPEPVDDTKGERLNWDDIKTPVPEGSSEK